VVVFISLLCAAAVFMWVAPSFNITSTTIENSALGIDIVNRVQETHLNIDPIPLIRMRALILGIGIVWAVVAGVTNGLNAVILPAVLMLVGWKAVDGYLNTLQKKRQEEIAREFPLFVNMIRVFSKASDLYVAIDTSRQMLQGELRRQLDIMMQELQSCPIKEALRRMAERCNYTPMNSLVSILISGMETGSDIDEILEGYAKRTYEASINEAKRKVKSQPVFMSILPALLGFFLLLVLVYPLFSDIIQKLSF
jgi:Flp pilus assembly protein TadB